MINALAFSIHPNGVVVYVVFFLGILFNFKSFRVKDYFFLVFTFLLSTVIFFKLLVFDTSLQGVISDFQNYRGVEYKFYQEHIRYLGFVVYYPFFVLPFAVGGGALFSGNLKKGKIFLRLGFLLAFLFLFLSTRKWAIYLSLLVPFVGIGLAFFFDSWKQTEAEIKLHLFCSLVFLFVINSSEFFQVRTFKGLFF